MFLTASGSASVTAPSHGSERQGPAGSALGEGPEAMVRAVLESWDREERTAHTPVWPQRLSHADISLRCPPCLSHVRKQVPETSQERIRLELVLKDPGHALMCGLRGSG